MLFSSPVFVYIFLPVVVVVFFALDRVGGHTISKSWLLVASATFYGWWNPIYLSLLIASVLVNWFVSSAIRAQNENGEAARAKWLFLLGLAFNLGLLGFFKYADFFISNVNTVAGSNFVLLHLVLPLGISFFTLQQVAYLVDVYEGLAKEHAFLNYALFVSFFPQLIAGPIVHHAEMMPQFARGEQGRAIPENMSRGVFVFIVGLFKKLVIADSLSSIVVAGFDQAESLNMLAAWVASLAFSFQIYFDFSGYTDMATGAALMLNIRLPLNFNSPYRALTLINFWDRWHITLSVFINTYVYTPILRSFKRITLRNAMVATLLAMLISGLWHGAAWTFVAWGGLHGLGLVVCHLWRKQKRRMPSILAWLITFNFVNIANVVFRAQTAQDAGKVIGGMFGFNGVMLPTSLADMLSGLSRAGVEFGTVLTDVSAGPGTVFALGLLLAIIAFARNSIELMDGFRPRYLTLAGAVVLLLSSLYKIGANSEFLYFDF